jgi:TetR/AcrR family transcriptional repressor of nem operon
MNANTRERLLDAGVALFWREGYTAAGLSGILREAEVPKGSFYHFFESKEDFLRAALDRYCTNLLTQLAAALGPETNRSALTRIDGFLSFQLQPPFTDDYRGCMFGNLAQELGEEPDLRPIFERIFREMEALFETALLEGQAAGEVRRDIPAADLAAYVVQGFYGALLRSKAAGSKAPVSRNRDLTLKFLKAE